MRFSDSGSCGRPVNSCKTFRVNSSSQPERVAELQQSNAGTMSGGNNFINQALSCNNQQQQFNLRNPSATSTPYDMLKYPSQVSFQIFMNEDVSGNSKSTHSSLYPTRVQNHSMLTLVCIHFV